MKQVKILILALCALLVAPSSYAQDDVKLENERDSASYALGILLGKQLKGQGVDSLNYDAFINAMSDYFQEKDSFKMSIEQAGMIYSQFIENINAAEGREFLKANAKKEGVQTTPSGLQYKVIKMGEGPKPGPTDKVVTHYTGMLIDGKIFDSSVERGTPLTFGVNQVIPGWTEALMMMPVGSKWELYIPFELGYGSRGAGDIPPYATLVFEVELIEIKSPASPETPQK